MHGEDHVTLNFLRSAFRKSVSGWRNPQFFPAFPDTAFFLQQIFLTYVFIKNNMFLAIKIPFLHRLVPDRNPRHLQSTADGSGIAERGVKVFKVEF